MKLYINDFEELKILKKKKPFLKWASREDILKWYPDFPFIAYISSDNRMTFSVLEAESGVCIQQAVLNSKVFFRKKSLEIE